jgi:hypothetical protein
LDKLFASPLLGFSFFLSLLLHALSLKYDLRVLLFPHLSLYVRRIRFIVHILQLA